MERDQLARLLDGTGDAGSACRSALLDGADLTSWAGQTPASRMVPAYERRRAQSLAAGTATVGFAEALSSLRDAGPMSVNLCQVTVADPPYMFMVFLAGEPASVLACFGIQQLAATA